MQMRAMKPITGKKNYDEIGDENPVERSALGGKVAMKRLCCHNLRCYIIGLRVQTLARTKLKVRVSPKG